MHSRRRPRITSVPVLLCVVALVCTGCQLRLRIDVDVNRNGGGLFALAVAADEELMSLATDAGADPLGDLAARGEELVEGWRVSDETDDAGARTVTLSAPFEDPEQFAALTREVSAALDADEATLLEPLRLAVDEEVRLTGGAAARPGRAVREYGLSRKAAVRRIDQAEAFDYDVTVTLPGEVTSSNATGERDGALLWEVPVGERVEIAAASTRPGPPILKAVGGAVAGAAVAGVVLWLLARRRRGRA